MYAASQSLGQLGSPLGALGGNLPLGLPAPTDVPRHTLSGFRGSPDTLELMRRQALGPRGEQSVLVRMAVEEIVRHVRPKDYLGEILAVRHFATSRLRYLNDQLHVEYVKDPERIVEEVAEYGTSRVDCDEIAEFIGTAGLALGREADFVVVGFGAPGEYSHVFARIKEPKSGQWIICDPVAGTDERTMASRVTTSEVWSLDEL